MAVFLGLCACWQPARAATGAACQPVTVAVDTSLGSGFVPNFLGSAVGETFTAADTLIRSITVWRPHELGTNDVGYAMKLWVVRTDSTGIPLAYDVIQEGPILQVRARSTDGLLIKVLLCIRSSLVLAAPWAVRLLDPPELC